MSESIASLWESYRLRVLPPDAGADYLRETRRAFHAGAHAMLHTCSGLGETSVSVADGVDTLNRLMAESDQFARDVVEGRA